MPVDERARHLLYRKPTEMVGRMEGLEHQLTAKIEQSARRLVMWTSSMVLASAALAFVAGRLV
jgi:hypothetical protein